MLSRFPKAVECVPPKAKLLSCFICRDQFQLLHNCGYISLCTNCKDVHPGAVQIASGFPYMGCCSFCKRERSLTKDEDRDEDRVDYVCEDCLTWGPCMFNDCQCGKCERINPTTVYVKHLSDFATQWWCVNCLEEDALHNK
jgi:hypothetical protein